MVPDGVVDVFWNDRQGRLRAPWRLVGHLLLMAVLVTGAFLGAAALLAAAGVSLQSVPVLGLLLTAAVAVLSVALAAHWLDRRPLADVGVRGPASDLAVGVGLGGGAMAGVFLTELAAGWIRVTGVAASDARSFPLALLSGFVLMAAVGVYEELLVRGYWLTNLAEGLCWLPRVDARRGVVVALALTSAAFGLLHASNPNATAASTVTITVAGVVLGLGYVLTESLALPVGFHFAWNFAQAFVFGFPTSGIGFGASVVAVEQSGPPVATGGAFGPEGGAVGLVWLLVAAAAMGWWVRRTRGDLRLRTAVARPAARPAGERAGIDAESG